MIVKIQITGLAYCRRENIQADGRADLRVLFLHPISHNLKLRVQRQPVAGTNTDLLYNIDQDSYMILTPTNAVSVPHTVVPDENIDHVINIDNLHTPNPPHLSFKRLATDPQTGLPIIGLSYLTIPGVHCYTAKTFNKRLDIWRLQGNTKTLKHSTPTDRLVGTHLGIEFNVNVNGNLALGVWHKSDVTTPNTPPAVPANQLLTFRNPTPPPASNYEIIFDNTCDDPAFSSDFQYYYEILEDTVNRFKFEEVRPFAVATANEQTDKDTACNVVIGDPQCPLEQYFQNGGHC